MSDEQEFNDQVTVHEGTPRWVWLAMVVLAAVSVASLAVGWNATTHAKNAETALASQSKMLQQNVDTLAQRIAESDQTNAQLRNDLVNVTDNLKTWQNQVTTTRRQTSQIREDYSKKIEGV